uniref:Endophilin-B1 n=1 Tax=Canis lupus familiaris TaxID=9615 RepID=A0A8P0PLT1_CANLF
SHGECNPTLQFSNFLLQQKKGDARVAQRLSAGFGPGRDPGVPRSSPASSSLQGACFSLCLAFWVCHEQVNKSLEKKGGGIIGVISACGFQGLHLHADHSHSALEAAARPPGGAAAPASGAPRDCAAATQEGSLFPREPLERLHPAAGAGFLRPRPRPPWRITGASVSRTPPAAGADANAQLPAPRARPPPPKPPRPPRGARPAPRPSLARSPRPTLSLPLRGNDSCGGGPGAASLHLPRLPPPLPPGAPARLPPSMNIMDFNVKKLAADAGTFLSRAVQKERKLLQNKRLDLDAAKTRLKKAKAAETKASSEQELRITQSEFDRQAEITRLLLEGISSTHAHHLRCLNDFVEAQMTYYAQCYQYMLDLQKQLGSFPSSYCNNNQTSVAPVPSASSNVIGSSTLTSTSGLVIASPTNLNDLKECSGSRKARVLYDYDAANSSELSLLADEVITVFSVVGMDSDWLMGERGNQKGRVPITYLELLN